MEQIKSPEIYNKKSIFLAGGITGCPDWQSEMTNLLKDKDVTILNPRCDHFDVNDEEASYKQILWEHHHLRKADIIVFWFPKETLCPITLYELGTWSMANKPLCIGIEHGYQRINDVLIQTALVRPEIRIVNSLSDLAIMAESKLNGIINTDILSSR